VTVERTAEDWPSVVDAWADRDADYVSVNHLYRGYGPADHLESLEATAGRLADAGYL